MKTQTQRDLPYSDVPIVDLEGKQTGILEAESIRASVYDKRQSSV